MCRENTKSVRMIISLKRKIKNIGHAVKNRMLYNVYLYLKDIVVLYDWVDSFILDDRHQLVTAFLGLLG